MPSVLLVGDGEPRDLRIRIAAMIALEKCRMLRIAQRAPVARINGVIAVVVNACDDRSVTMRPIVESAL
jgi:hypothetical protein